MYVYRDEDLKKVISKIDSKEPVFEVPAGTSDAGLYHERTRENYTEVIEKHYGEIMGIIDSGATNDPYNKRTIFYCKKNEV